MNDLTLASKIQRPELGRWSWYCAPQLAEPLSVISSELDVTEILRLEDKNITTL